MLVATLSMAVMVAQVPVADEVLVSPDACQTCQTCAGGNPAVTNLIVRLQKSASPRDRERAARTLRDVDWRRHPEVPGALAFSLMRDPARQVRYEAAESLTRMRANTPAVQQALRRAASTDPSLLTRLQARKGLKVLGQAPVVTSEVIVGLPPATGPVIIEGAPSPEPGVLLDSTPMIEPIPSERSNGILDSTPRALPSDESLEAIPSAEPGPSLDSSVRPKVDDALPASADELAPLPDPDASKTQDKVGPTSSTKAPARKPEARVTPAPRPRVANARTGLFRSILRPR